MTVAVIDVLVVAVTEAVVVACTDTVAVTEIVVADKLLCTSTKS